MKYFSPLLESLFEEADFYCRVEKNWVRDDFTFDLGKGSTSGATRDFHRCQCYAEQVSRADTHCERNTSGGWVYFGWNGWSWKNSGEKLGGLDCSSSNARARASSLWFMKRKQHGGWNECCRGTREKVGLESVVLQLESVFITEIWRMRMRIPSDSYFLSPDSFSLFLI